MIPSFRRTLIWPTTVFVSGFVLNKCLDLALLLLVLRQPIPLIPFVAGTLIALIFCIAGILVWAADLPRATIWFFSFFAFCLMSLFGLEAAAVYNHPLASALTMCLASLVIPLNLWLILFFPRNWLAENILSLGTRRLMLILAWLAAILGCFFAAFAFFRHLWWANDFIFLVQSFYVYYSLGLLGSLLLALFLFFRSKSHRIRHQLLLFILAVTSAVFPVAILTVIPELFSLPAIDGSISGLGCGAAGALFLSMLLRYQRFYTQDFQTMIRWLIGLIGLLTLAALVPGTLGSSAAPGEIVGISALVGVLGTSWWIASQKLLTRLLSNESLKKNLPPLQLKDTLSLDEVARVLTQTVMEVCETRLACFFVRHAKSSSYTLTPFVVEEHSEQDCAILLASLAHFPSLLRLDGPEIMPSDHPFFTKRQPFVFLRDLPEYSLGALDGLLFSVRDKSGEQIGLLVLGERRDHQSYAEPDLLILDALVARFGPALSLARLYYSQYTNNMLFAKIFFQPPPAMSSREDFAKSVVRRSALIFGAAVIWFKDGEQGQWRQYHLGMGLKIPLGEELFEHLEAQDWLPYFFDGQDCQLLPPTLQSRLGGGLPAFVWLPLVADHPGGHLGILLLPNEQSKSREEVILLFSQYLCAEFARFLMQEHLKQQIEEEQEEQATLLARLEQGLAQLIAEPEQSRERLLLLIKELRAQL